MLCNRESFPGSRYLCRDIRGGGGQTIWRVIDKIFSLWFHVDMSDTFAR